MGLPPGHTCRWKTSSPCPGLGPPRSSASCSPCSVSKTELRGTHVSVCTNTITKKQQMDMFMKNARRLARHGAVAYPHPPAGLARVDARGAIGCRRRAQSREARPGGSARAGGGYTHLFSSMMRSVCKMRRPCRRNFGPSRFFLSATWLTTYGCASRRGRRSLWLLVPDHVQQYPLALVTFSPCYSRF